MTRISSPDPTVAVPAPGRGPQQWAGAPSAALDRDGTVVLAYRVRTLGADGAVDDANLVATSPDGVTFTDVVRLDKARWGATMVEKPALLRTDDGWRMYVSCATPAGKHWWVGLIEADSLEGLADAHVVHVFDGDDETAVKDPVVRHDGDLWEAWLCCHHLDVPGAEDRMSTAYATSDDGLRWDWHGTVLSGRPGEWDARGARVTAVLPDGSFAYDGRATPEENWFERSGRADVVGGHLLARADGPVEDVRYLEVLALPDGSLRAYYEARLPDESHELRTRLLT